MPRHASVKVSTGCAVVDEPTTMAVSAMMREQVRSIGGDLSRSVAYRLLERRGAGRVKGAYK